MKKVFSLTIALLILIGGIPLSSSAAGSVPGFVQPVQTPQTINQNTWEGSSEALSRIPHSSVLSYTNNGGQYSSSTLDKAFDGDLKTHWETGRPNSSSFTNTVTVTFRNNETPNHIDYICRQDGTQPKGSLEGYKLYYSTSASGEDFRLLLEGSFPGAFSNMVSIYFAPTQMKRFRLEFTKCTEDWASMSELRFYKAVQGQSPDSILANIFTDKTYSELKSGVNQAAVDAQISAANASLTGAVRDKTVEVLNEAKNRLLSSPDFFDNMTFELTQRGNMNSEKLRTDMALGLYPFDATGFYVSPNETISVYADFADNEPGPTVVFGQYGEIRGNTPDDTWEVNGWMREYTLKPGINVITAPAYDVFAPSAIYFCNNSAPDHQSYVPKVRLVGGTRFPMYVHGVTDPAAFRAELDAYLSNVVSVSQEANEFNRSANNLTNKYYDICETVSENVILTSSATGCKRALTENNPSGRTMWDTMDVWEEMYDEFMWVGGFDVENPNLINYKPAGKFICRVFWVKNPGVAAYATTGYTAYNSGSREKASANEYRDIFKYDIIADGGGWAYYHEIGHQFDDSNTVRGEVTNNIYSIAMQDHFKPYPVKNRLDANAGRAGSQNMWPRIKEGNISNKHPMSTSAKPNPEATNQDGDNVWYQLAEIYQLFMVYDDESIEKTGYGIYGAMHKEFIENPSKYSSNNSREIAVQNMALAMSNVLGKDITPHFENYKHVINSSAKQSTGVSSLPKETGRKTWYADAKMRDPASRRFSNTSVSPVVNAIASNGVTLQLSLGNESAKSFLCYEISKGGKIIGLEYGTENSSSATFNDPTGTLDTVYTVTAYDRECYPSQTVTSKPGAFSLHGLNSDKAKALVNTPITWTADASGGTGTIQYKFDLYKDGTRIAEGQYSTSRTFSYTPSETGNYYVTVFAKTSVDAEKSMNSSTVRIVTDFSPQLDVSRVRVNTWSTNGTDAYGINYLFDGREDTYWHANWGAGSGSATKSEGLADIDLGNKKTVDTIEIDKRYLSGGRAPIKEVRVWIHSEAGGTFPNGETMRSYTEENVPGTQITSDFAQAGWKEITGLNISGLSVTSSQRQTVTVDLNTPVDTRYIRIGVTCAEINDNGASNDYVQVSEIRLFGTDSTTVTNADTPQILSYTPDRVTDLGTSVPIAVIASVSYGELSYQWYEADSRSSVGTAIPGATLYTYVPPTFAAGVKYYYCVVTNTDLTATGNQTATAQSPSVSVIVNGTVEEFDIIDIDISDDYTFTAETVGEANGVKYYFYVIGGGKVHYKELESDDKYFSFTPQESGNYSVRIYAIDDTGRKVVCAKDFTV